MTDFGGHTGSGRWLPVPASATSHVPCMSNSTASLLTSILLKFGFFRSALRIVCAKVEQPGSYLSMSPWPMCASSGTGAVTQCFDIYCPMRVPNSKFFMVRLNCYNFENFAISWSIRLGQCSHHAQFCADLICPIINYHNTSTLLSYSFMGWGFLIWSF